MPFSSQSRRSFLAYLFAQTAAFGRVLDGFHRVEGLLDSVGPISWLAVKVSRGDYNDRIFVNTVDQPVRKARQQAPSDSRFDFG